MNLVQLKQLFRRNIKPVPGGPAVGTPGANRAAGVLNALDAVAEFADSQQVVYAAGANIDISPANVISVTGKADEDGRFDHLTPLDPAVPHSALTWRYMGNPILGNVSLGPFDPNTTVGDGLFRCTFGAGMYYCELGDNLTYSTFANTQIGHKTGFDCSFLVHGAGCREVYYGNGCTRIVLGSQVGTVRIGDSCSDLVIAAGTKYVFLGNEVKNCIIGAGCDAVKLGDGCERVELYNCGSGNNTKPFEVPAGTKDVVYRNNVLVGSSGPGSSAPLAAIVAVVAGVEKGYATLADAFADNPTAIYLHADLEVSTIIGGRFFGKLFGNGHTLTLTSAGQVKLGRYASLYQLAVQGAGSISITGSGSSAGTTVPPADECVQLVDCAIDVALKLEAASAYQGLALRGTTAVTNLAAGGGPVYLYDLAEVNQPLPAGFTLYDRRPGAAAGGGATYTAGTGITISPANEISTNAERVYFSKWTINNGQFMTSITTNAGDGYRYYHIAPPRKESEILPVGATPTDPATGAFTAPYHGLYKVEYYLAVVGLSAGDDFTAIISNANDPKPPLSQLWGTVGVGQFNEIILTDTIELAANQQIKPAVGATHAQAGQQFQFVCRVAVSLYKFLS